MAIQIEIVDPVRDAAIAALWRIAAMTRHRGTVTLQAEDLLCIESVLAMACEPDTYDARAHQARYP